MAVCKMAEHLLAYRFNLFFEAKFFKHMFRDKEHCYCFLESIIKNGT